MRTDHSMTSSHIPLCVASSTSPSSGPSSGPYTTPYTTPSPRSAHLHLHLHLHLFIHLQLSLRRFARTCPTRKWPLLALYVCLSSLLVTFVHYIRRNRNPCDVCWLLSRITTHTPPPPGPASNRRSSSLCFRPVCPFAHLTGWPANAPPPRRLVSYRFDHGPRHPGMRDSERRVPVPRHTTVLHTESSATASLMENLQPFTYIPEGCCYCSRFTEDSVPLAIEHHDETIY